MNWAEWGRKQEGEEGKAQGQLAHQRVWPLNIIWCLRWAECHARQGLQGMGSTWKKKSYLNRIWWQLLVAWLPGSTWLQMCDAIQCDLEPQRMGLRWLPQGCRSCAWDWPDISRFSGPPLRSQRHRKAQLLELTCLPEDEFVQAPGETSHQKPWERRVEGWRQRPREREAADRAARWRGRRLPSIIGCDRLRKVPRNP